MDANNNRTSQPEITAIATGMTPVEEAVQFVNAEVLSPPTANPMSGIATVMIEQSTGMMVQDLQSFLKGFEQIGIVALSRLANNLLTYGTWSENKPPPKGASTKGEDQYVLGDGNDMIRDLFKIVSDYAEAKTKISNVISNQSILQADLSDTKDSQLPSYSSINDIDAEKKKMKKANEEEKLDNINDDEGRKAISSGNDEKLMLKTIIKPAEVDNKLIPEELHIGTRKTIFSKLINRLKNKKS